VWSAGKAEVWSGSEVQAGTQRGRVDREEAVQK